ncbi:DUF308 domain-containing protein [Martelella endophytica]|uniref:Membrane protein n=1 Tax=Martelella endophytica TaxID=1486262 RepID=A0A0D5LLY7_MAREN|nr:DUF308 domain-containing protein [Martelella endophytica]AJY45166.1 membrane protein [Martelella endophytica]
MTTNNNEERWLRGYYAVRAGFSVIWVLLALTIGAHSMQLAVVLLLVYPAWDGIANYFDAARSGGLGRNRTQAINVAVSAVTTLAVAIALGRSMNAVLAVFGAWAFFAGLLQLATAVHRWKRYGAQWVMVLSGGQSALAGVLFIVMAQKPEMPSIGDVAGYAGVGAFYFLVSAIWLSVAMARRQRAA